MVIQGHASNYLADSTTAACLDRKIEIELSAWPTLNLQRKLVDGEGRRRREPFRHGV
jgi:hypothetical protein